MTTTIDHAPPLTNPAIRRFSIVLSAALLPFIAALGLSGLFYLLGNYKVTAGTPPKTEFASINYPKLKTLVGSSFIAKGSVDKLPADTSAYLMVKRSELYWPKKDLGNRAGAWSQEIKETKRQGSKLYLVVLALSSDDKKLIDQWYANSKKTGKYPGIGQFSTAHEIAAIEVRQQ